MSHVCGHRAAAKCDSEKDQEIDLRKMKKKKKGDKRTEESSLTATSNSRRRCRAFFLVISCRL